MVPLGKELDFGMAKPGIFEKLFRLWEKCMHVGYNDGEPFRAVRRWLRQAERQEFMCILLVLAVATLVYLKDMKKRCLATTWYKSLASRPSGTFATVETRWGCISPLPFAGLDNMTFPDQQTYNLAIPCVSI